MSLPADTLESLVEQLSLAEKLQLMDGDREFWPGLWGMLLKDDYHRRPFGAGALPERGIEGLRFVDGPRGVVLTGGATSFPVTMARGATWDPALEERVGDAIGREVRARGANLYGGVCVNLLRHPAWGRAQETYGEDPVLLGELGAALTRGVGRHAIACVKHFALNSMENARFKVDVQVAPRPLHEIYLPHFKRCVEAGAGAVMSAYNAVNGEFCGQSRELLQGILKDRWGFEGFVVTDFIFGVRDAQRGVMAGLDLEMPFQMIFRPALARLVAEGRIPLERIDDAARRILRPQLGLPPAADYPRSLAGCGKHRALAREVATKAIVLLKNDESVLPLGDRQRVGLFGPLAAQANLGDRGSSDGRPPYVVTPLQGLRRALGGRVDYCPDRRAESVAALARDVDVAVVVVGYTHEHEGEHVLPPDLARFAELIPLPRPLSSWRGAPAGVRRLWTAAVKRLGGRASRLATVRLPGSQAIFGAGGDRVELGLPPEDIKLIERVAAANPRTVVVVMAGSALLMETWRHAVPGIVMLWYPGMEGGAALAEILTGRAAPSGRLPFAIPTHTRHLPSFDRDAEQVTYDLWHGYRLLERDGHAPAFPFGFGLSYTRFGLDRLELARDELSASDTIELSVRVRNLGAREGDCCVQLYVGADDSAVERAPRELKAFQRCPLAAGEARRLVFRLPVTELAIFDEDTDDFVVEPVTYRLMVGQHSLDQDCLQTELRVSEAAD